MTPIFIGDAPRAVIHMVSAILARALCSLRIEHAGRVPRRGPLLVVANHGGYLDPVFLQMGTPRPLRYLVTSDFFDLSLARPFFLMAGSIRVPEGHMPRETLRAALGVLAAGGAVGVFPEGQLTLTGAIGPFRPGAAFLAAKSGAPIVPAFIDGSYGVWAKRRRLPRQARVRIRFGEPFRLTDARDDERLRRAVLETRPEP